jgi:hemerythrin-like domain-containing protein
MSGDVLKNNMATITNTMVVEHRVFLTVFEQIEGRLSGLKTLAEVKFLAGLIISLLEKHGEHEENLSYAALDHALAERGQVDLLYQDHKEIDERLAQTMATQDLKIACGLLKETITAVRKHFQREERIIFPLIEKTLQETTLNKLNDAWIHPGMPTMSSAMGN